MASPDVQTAKQLLDRYPGATSLVTSQDFSLSSAGSANSNGNETIRVLLISAWARCLGCTTWGSKMAMGDQHYPSVKTGHVVILFEKPARLYKEIGLVSSLGGWFASDGDNYHKMQMAAAQLGGRRFYRPGVPTAIPTGLLQYPKTSGIAIKYTD